MTWRWTLVLLVACGTSKSERDDKEVGARSPAPEVTSQRPSTQAPPTQPTPPRVVQIPEPAIVLPRELAFEVLERGRGKPVALRYAAKAGDTSRFVMRTELTSRELAGGTWQGPNKLPAILTPFDVTVESGQRIRVEPRTGEIDGKASAHADAYLAGWAAIVDRAFAIEVDARARVAGVADRDAGADEIVQRLLATAVPVPEEPIGEGARWRVVTALRQQSAVLKQTATYTLVSRTNRRWKIAVDIQRLAERQQIGSTELVAIVRRLQGTVEIDPGQPLPTLGKLSVQSTVHVREGDRETIVEDTGTIALSSTTPTSR